MNQLIQAFGSAEPFGSEQCGEPFGSELKAELLTAEPLRAELLTEVQLFVHWIPHYVF